MTLPSTTVRKVFNKDPDTKYTYFVILILCFYLFKLAQRIQDYL